MTQIEDNCEHDYLDWDEAPDYYGCSGDSLNHSGCSMSWFGECYDCGARVRQRFVPQKVELSK